MKKFLMVTLFGMLSACNKDDGMVNDNNPYLPSYSVNKTINLGLPAYSNLQFAGNSVFISGADAGIRGIIVFNTGSGFTAFDAACPNQALSSCSTMQINGAMAVCPCDDKQYSLFYGTSQGMPYPMRRYNVEVNGNSLTIFN
ncbi:Rieske (2Fe-2S) protein [Flavobacterium suncheonense]|uniref:Rieske (2Fe-2S) protein n=1 Tax=Flavobacterium suncheonense TaxID=350894 RepID=UPI003FA3AB6D